MSDLQPPKCNLLATAGSPFSFLSLPGELRNRIYELLSPLEDPIDAWCARDLRGKLTPGLFRVNKTVHREACSLFYGQNCFDFEYAPPEDLALFLQKIGSTNAAYIRQIIIRFPRLMSLDHANLTLDEGSTSFLASIQNSCGTVSILTVKLDNRYAWYISYDDRDHHQVILKLVDTHLRAAVPFLREITLEPFEYGPSDDVMQAVRSLGWTINILKVNADESSSSGTIDEISFADSEEEDDSGEFTEGRLST